jgi:hypothetical protein
MRSSARWLAVIALMGTIPLSAQSLADVARQEEARRKAITMPGRVYTNDSLRPVPPAPPAPARPSQPAAPAEPVRSPSTAPASPEAGSPAGQGAAAAEGQKDEAYWRKRLQAEREALRRAQVLADALQSRINALTTDFVNRDDPAQRAVIATDRQNAIAELDRMKQEIAERTKAIGAVQEEGRRAGVPAGWLR